MAVLNEELRPTAEELDQARRVLAAYDTALAEGVAAIAIDGKMIDVPVVERARLLRARGGHCGPRGTGASSWGKGRRA